MFVASRLLPLLLAATAGGFAVAQRTPDEALRALQEGNRRYAADRSVPQPLGEGVRRTLARGQSPFAIVLSCADSRVPPEHVFNAGLGELFVVRVAGHCADAETIASIEYAVEHLGASLCVVLGHEQCGAVAASVAQSEPSTATRHSLALQQLLERIEPAVRKAKALDLGGKALLGACEEEHAHHTAHECLRRSALLRRYASVGKFRMVAARYHLQSGEVEWLPNRPLPPEPAAADAHAGSGAPQGVPPHVALRMLQAGHRRFLGDGKPSADLGAQRREALTHGQQPLAIVLTCADSRVAPEHVFDAGLGELFVVRIAGNTVNDDALASIEYAAGHLGASLLLVMGHSKCGAVQAAADHPEGQELSPNLRALLLRLEPAVAESRAAAKGRDLVDLAVRANARRAVQEARSRSATLRALEHQGRITLLSCVYDLASGDVEWLKDSAAPAADAESPTTPPAAAPHGHGETAAPATPPPHANGPAAHRAPAAADPHAHAPTATAPHQATTPIAAHELPVMDWVNHAAPAGESHASAPPTAPPTAPGHAAAHAAHDTHGTGTEPAHGGQPETATPHTAPSTPAAAAHPAHAPAAAIDPTARAPWRDPIVLVGVCGVVSLLVAALLAMRRD
jgi:carbonic anhydrase